MLCPSCHQPCRDTAVLCVRCGASLREIDPGTTDVPSSGSAWDLTSRSTPEPAEIAPTPAEIPSPVETATPSAPPLQVAPTPAVGPIPAERPTPAEGPTPAAEPVSGRSMNAVWAAGLAVLALGAIGWVWSGRQAADRAAEAPNEIAALDQAAPPAADDIGDTAASDATLGPMMGEGDTLDAAPPPIEEGMLYPKARGALLEAGWVPVEQRADCGIICTSLRREGYPETEDCADAGAAPCRFIFAGPSGKLLVVGTVGENLAVSAWSEGDPDRAAADAAVDEEARAQIASARFPAYARQAAYEIVSALKSRDMGVVADHAHPTRGVLFSPYAFIDRSEAQVWRADDLRRWSADTRIRVWGAEDGTGFPIKLTPAGYFERFVFPLDFTTGTQVSVDDDQARGNAINNAAEVFPDGVRVEFYRPPSAAGGQIDWRALRLVFVPVDGEPRLVAIIHDQWTG